MIDFWGPMLAWGGFAILVYTYVGYPAGLALVSKMLAKVPKQPNGNSGASTWPRDSKPPISIVISVRNGQSDLPRRLTELTKLLETQNPASEIVVVSDGSTDATSEIARSFSDAGVRTIEFESNRGKATALSEAVATINSPIVAFADVRQRWSLETLDAIVDSLEDPQVGGVSGELILEESPGVLAGVGVYWRYEKWIRKTESIIGSQIGVTGAIAAVRRECFRPIPAGTILDDVYWPMQVVLQGRRVVFNSDAKAYDRLPSETAGEFRRKVRTLAGNFQLVAKSPRLLVPGVNPAWVQFVSHKLFRLACPWAMIGMAVGCLLAWTPIYQIALIGWVALTLLGVAGLVTPLGRHNRFASAAGSFVLLNAAAWVAFWVWASGRSDRLWSRSAFAPNVPVPVSQNSVSQNSGSQNSGSQDPTSQSAASPLHGDAAP